MQSITSAYHETITSYAHVLELHKLESINCYFEILNGKHAGIVIHTCDLYHVGIHYLPDNRVVYIWQHESLPIQLSDLARVRVYWSETNRERES